MVREGLTEEVKCEQRPKGGIHVTIWGECCRQRGSTCKGPEVGVDCLPNLSGCVLQ